MRRYPPSLWDTVRAAIGCAAVLAVVLLVGVVLYLIAPYVFEWMRYVTCYVQQLLGGECTPVLPTAIQEYLPVLLSRGLSMGTPTLFYSQSSSYNSPLLHICYV